MCSVIVYEGRSNVNRNCCLKMHFMKAQKWRYYIIFLHNLLIQKHIFPTTKTLNFLFLFCRKGHYFCKKKDVTYLYLDVGIDTQTY